MKDYVQAVGDAFKKARAEQNLTLEAVAERSGVDMRTVINIEQYRGNPKLEKLYPLVRTLRIDAREIFNPEMQRESPSIRQLRFLIEECSEQEATTLIPVIEAVLVALRSDSFTEIK